MKTGAMRTSLILITIFGALTSVVLIRLSLPSVEGELGVGSSLCAATARVNCDYVLASRWAKIGPVPSSVVGFAYFSTLAVWFALVGVPNDLGRRWHRVPMVLCGTGLLYSAWLIWIMAVKLPYWCTWCLAAHGLNVILCILVFGVGMRIHRVDSPSDVAEPRPTAARGWGVLIGCIGFVMVTILSGVALQLQRTARQFQLAHLDAANNSDFVLWKYSRSPSREVTLDERDYVLGPAQAVNQVVVFSDFECVNCYGFHRYAARLYELFPDAVRIVFKHFPLDRSCNPHVTQTVHHFACEAARAAEAAQRLADLGKAYRYHTAIFTRGGRLDLRPYERFAVELGLDAEAFRRTMDDPAVAAKIEDDIAQGARLGVVGTPTVFLNGRKLETWRLLTRDPSPQVDVEATDRMWERLLGTPAKKQ